VNAFSSIDVDKNSASAYFGTLYVATPDFPTGTSSGNNINTYVVRSTDNGDTWSSRVLVNDDGVTTNTQIFPWLAVDQSDGTVNVAWYDTRVDGTNHRKSQVYYGRSVNGGTSFEANLLVHDNGANFTNAVNYCDENLTDNTNQNANQYGDYMGIAASNRQVHGIWTDTRNYFPVNGTKKEDAATSTIVNCSAPAWGATPAASCNGATLSISWTSPSWGTNATSGTYTVYRHTDAGCTSAAVQVAADIPGTSTTDAPPAGTYHYKVVAKNNCPGTALTPMSTASACSAAISFPDALVPVVTSPANATVIQTLCQ
jgi:hypothetical protein